MKNKANDWKQYLDNQEWGECEAPVSPSDFPMHEEAENFLLENDHPATEQDIEKFCSDPAVIKAKNEFLKETFKKLIPLYRNKARKWARTGQYCAPQFILSRLAESPYWFEKIGFGYTGYELLYSLCDAWGLDHYDYNPENVSDLIMH